MLDRLDAEIEELEKGQFAGQTDENGKIIGEKVEEESSVDDEVVVDDEEVIEPDLDELEPEEDLSDKEPEAEDLEEEGSEDEPKNEEEVKKPKRKSWKAEHELLDVRYRNLRAVTDAKLFELRNKVASLLTEADGREAQITELQNQLAAVSANTDIYADIFTKEDVDVLGEDAINAFKKANARSIEAAVAPLKNQLDTARVQGIEAKKVEAKAQREEAYNIFLRSLETLVPDYNTLNYDESFKQYMQEVEPGSNKTRQDELADAVSTGNTRWAATFFNSYKALRAAPSQKLEEKLLPKENAASTINTKSKQLKTYPIAEVEKFYDKLTRGDYNTSKQRRELGEKLERIYDRAYAEGRVI